MRRLTRQALDAWRVSVARLKRQTLTLFYACRDPRVPWYARLVTALVVAYAFSPLDLIPDVVPVLGLLDDALLLPLGIWLALRLLPSPVLAAARAQAAAHLTEARPTSRLGAALVVALWLVGLLGGGWLLQLYLWQGKVLQLGPG